MQAYLKKGDYDKNNVFIVGDAPEEIEIGKALGIKKIAISDGFYSNKRLRDSKPDYMVNNLSEVITILKQNAKKIR